MKYTLKLCMASLLLMPWSASQAIQLSEDFSLDLNIGTFSDYRSRGISQTQNDPAIQGSMTLSHSSGLYVGLWSSNVDFGYDSKARQENDYYVGYHWQATNNIALDVTYYQYEYPKEGGLNYSETFAKLSAYGGYVGGYYSDDLSGNQSYLYSFIGYQTTLPMDVGLDLRLGKVDFKDATLVDKSGRDRARYNEWQASISKTMVGLAWSLAYVDSDLSKAECYNYSGFDDVCSGNIVIGISKSF